MRYTYFGDRHTRPDLRGAQCDPVRRPDGKVVRGRNRNALVRLASGELVVAAGRFLRLNRREG